MNPGNSYGIDVMNENNSMGTIVYTVVCVLVIVLIITTTLIPVIEDSQTEIKTVGQNTTIVYSVAASSDTEVAITMSDGVISVNGYSVPASRDRAIALSESFLVQSYNNNTMVLITDGVQVSGITSMTLSNGTITYSGSESGTESYTGDVLYASATGNYGFFSTDSVFKINEDAVIWSYFSDGFDNSDLSPSRIGARGVLKGTYEEMQATFINVNTTVESVTMSLNVTDNKDLSYDVVSSSVMTLTTSDGSYTSSTKHPLIAPIEYVYISNTDNAIITLLSILPIMLMMIPIMVVVRLFRRD